MIQIDKLRRRKIRPKMRKSLVFIVIVVHFTEFPRKPCRGFPVFFRQSFIRLGNRIVFFLFLRLRFRCFFARPGSILNLPRRRQSFILGVALEFFRNIVLLRNFFPVVFIFLPEIRDARCRHRLLSQRHGLLLYDKVCANPHMGQF